MKYAPWARCALPCAIALVSATAVATDYYVATTGADTNDGLSAESPFATIDKAVSVAANASDVIYVAPGTYSTSAQYGPNLKAKLLGSGTSRDEVVIESAGTYRTLRMAAGSWLEKVTIVGEGTYKADKGGAIEMYGGTVTNCVVRDGTAKNASANLEGGNIYMENADALVVGCVISGGQASDKRGGNVYIASGTVRNCTISNGSSAKNIAGNVYIENGTLVDSTVTGGTASSRGGNLFLNHASALVSGCTIANGSTTSGDGGGNIYLNLGTVTNSTISGGTATQNGGNIYVNSASAIVSDCTISGGTANSSGGNIYMVNGVVSDSTIYGGTANGTGWADGGGNVFMNPGRLMRCSVSGGTAHNNQGGGIRSRNASSVIEDCLVFGNPTGGICLEGKGTHYNNTIVNNGEHGIWGYGSNPGTFVNCVIYGNVKGGAFNEWAGNHPAAADMSNCAFGQEKLKGTVDISTYDNSIFLADDSAFDDYANGDYHIGAISATLVDKGAVDNRANASSLDLDGNPRQSGTIDIGCYEYQKPDMTVSIVSVDKSAALAPATFTFTHAANGAADPSTLRFTYDFGDDTAKETTSATTISHEYANPGIYTVTITAASDCEDDVPATQSYPNYLTVSSPIVYVNPGNASAAFPYDTPETGYATVATAVAEALDGVEIHLANGVYEQTAKLSVSKAVKVIGNDANPEAVVLRNTATAQSGSADRRVMSIDNAGAVVSGLTLEGGQVYHGNGGNLNISAGMISNCVIRSGIAYAGTNAEYGMGAGVALSGSGIVSHCVITNNEVQGVASGKWPQGGAIVFPYGSSGKLRNCLVAGNRWIVDSADANGTAGILYHGTTGGSRVDNCTVAANSVSGTCNEASSAAGVRCDWNSAIRNTVFAGNRIGANVSNVYLIYAEEVWKDGLDTCVTEEALPSGNATCTTASLARIFNNFANGDYRPRVGGALYDKGREPFTAVTVDLAGNPRVFGKAIDIGCYECQSQPHTVILMR